MITAIVDGKSEHFGVLIDELARLPEKTIVDEGHLAQILKVSTRTIPRMVARRELPPPFRMGKRRCWFTGRILAHFERMDADEQLEVKRVARYDP